MKSDNHALPLLSLLWFALVYLVRFCDVYMCKYVWMCAKTSVNQLSEDLVTKSLASTRIHTYSAQSHKGPNRHMYANRPDKPTCVHMHTQTNTNLGVDEAPITRTK